MHITAIDNHERGIYPPASDRFYAIDDDAYDGPGSPIGTGPNAKAAIADLREQLTDRPEAALRRAEAAVSRAQARIDDVKRANPALVAEAWAEFRAREEDVQGALANLEEIAF